MSKSIVKYTSKDKAKEKEKRLIKISEIENDLKLLMIEARKRNISFLRDGIGFVIGRLGSIYADNNMKETVKDHSGYVDPEGNKSSGAKGFAIQIEKRIKEAYGLAREEMDEFALKHVTSLLELITQIIFHRQKEKWTRRKIKDTVYESIDDSGASYRRLVKLMRDENEEEECNN